MTIKSIGVNVHETISVDSQFKLIQTLLYVVEKEKVYITENYMKSNMYECI